jgi:nitrite reductase (NADH) small subunit/3-phenylpropionate/trans-cinnamate dioxygenase ferredoxin subunit
MGQLVKVAKRSQLRVDTGFSVEVAGRVVALFLHDSSPYAIDEHCPHAGGPLGAGHVQNGIVMCPWHGWRFRVTDGLWMDAPKAGTNARCYKLQEIDGEIYVDVDW